MITLETLAERTYYLFHGIREGSPTGQWFEIKLGFTGSFMGAGATLEEAITNALADEEKAKQ